MIIIPIIVGVIILSGIVVWWLRRPQDALVIQTDGHFWIHARNPIFVDSIGTPAHGEPGLSALVLSPNREFVVYLTRPVEAVAFIEAGGSTRANHVWLLNGRTLTETLIGPQPNDFDFTNSYYVHGLPAWSPDGTQLAWSVYDAINGRVFLVRYDLATRTTDTFAENIPIRLGAPVIWGEAGIIVYSERLHEFWLFHNDGQSSIAVHLPSVSDFWWIQNTGLCVCDEEGNLEIYDDRWQPATVEMFNPLNDQIALRYTPIAKRWEIVTKDGHYLLQNYHAPRTDFSITIAPKHRLVVYASDQVCIWHNGKTEILPLRVNNPSVIWSPLEWRQI